MGKIVEAIRFDDDVTFKIGFLDGAWIAKSRGGKSNNFQRRFYGKDRLQGRFFLMEQFHYIPVARHSNLKRRPQN
jgi:hypothetical protein